jgi:hypothetical protein
MIKVDKGVKLANGKLPHGRGRRKEEVRISTTRISNRQYNLLREFVHKPKMSADSAAQWDQRAFRSFLIRDWVSYTPERGFHLTEKGFLAWKAFEKTDVTRSNIHGPLTRYFSLEIYGARAEAS